MAMFRTFRTMKACNFTVFLVGFGLLLCYAGYLFEFLFLLDASFKWYVITISIILFILLCWAFLKTYLSDPGSVPKFWAVHV